MQIPYPESSDYVADGATAMENMATTIDETGLMFIDSTTIGSGVASVSMTNVFSSRFRNYKILLRINSASASVTNVYMQLDSSTGNYFSTTTFNQFDGTTTTDGNVSPGSLLSSGFLVGLLRNVRHFNAEMTIMSPQTNSRTAYQSRSTYQYPNNFGGISVSGGYHESTGQRTGFTIFPATGTITNGLIQVYGYLN